MKMDPFLRKASASELPPLNNRQDSDTSLTGIMMEWPTVNFSSGDEYGLYLSGDGLFIEEQEQQLLYASQDVGQEPSSTDKSIVSTSMQQTGTLPSNEWFEGKLYFSVNVRATTTNEIGYSKELGKIFVKPGVKFPIDFTLDFPSAMDYVDDLKIRALLMFTSEERKLNPVKRCITHSIGNNEELVNHVLRCCNPRADYMEDSNSKRCSVLIPVEYPQAGSSTITQLYKSMCSHSCAGGINRNDVDIIFTLELKGEVIGRCTLGIRVCSCPKRDMEKAEERKAMEPKPKKRKVNKVESSDEGDDVYTLKIRGRENYELLKKLCEKLDKKP